MTKLKIGPTLKFDKWGKRCEKVSKNTWWPKSKCNGKDITGITVKIELDLSWWNLKFRWNYGMPYLGIGPLHFWFKATYRDTKE